MIINGKWMNEPEILALISQLIADKKRLERQLEQGVKRWSCKGKKQNVSRHSSGNGTTMVCISYRADG